MPALGLSLGHAACPLRHTAHLAFPAARSRQALHPSPHLAANGAARVVPTFLEVTGGDSQAGFCFSQGQQGKKPESLAFPSSSPCHPRQPSPRLPSSAQGPWAEPLCHTRCPQPSRLPRQDRIFHPHSHTCLKLGGELLPGLAALAGTEIACRCAHTAAPRLAQNQRASSKAEEFTSARGALLLYQTFPAAPTSAYALPATRTTATAPLPFWEAALTEFLPTSSPRATLVCKTASQVASAAGPRGRSLG